MTEDDLPDLSHFRFERSLYDLTRPLDEFDQRGTPAINALSDDAHVDDEDDIEDTYYTVSYDDAGDDGDDVDEFDDDGLDDDELDQAIDELIHDILDDAAGSPRRPTPPRFKDLTARLQSARRSHPHVPLADRLLEFVYANLDGVSVMIASTVPGTGAYGRLTIDPLHSTEVRLFGWPRLQPHSPDADRSAMAALLRLGFRRDEGDWVWRVESTPALAPVAAHAAQRAMAEAWRIAPHETSSEHIRLYALDSVQIMLIASGVLCSWCADGECRGTGAH